MPTHNILRRGLTIVVLLTLLLPAASPPTTAAPPSVNPAHPLFSTAPSRTRIGRIRTDPSATLGTGYFGGQSNDPINPAYPLFSTTDAQNVEFVGHIGGAALAVAVQGDYAYIGAGPRLTILDISNPASPTVVGKTLPLPDIVHDVAVVGSYAYVADGSAGLRVVDISTPVNPAEVGFYDTPGGANGVAVAGGYAYVVGDSGHPDYIGGLRVVDVSTPANPTEVGFYDTPGSASGVAVAGGYAYVADARGGLRVVDVSTPFDPTEVGFYDTPGRAYGVAVAGGYAYVADWNAGLRVVDVSEPSNPTEVGFYDTPGYAERVAVAGGYAYVADGYGGGYYGGLRVVDVSVPANPTEVGYYDTPGYARGVAVAGGYAYVADYGAGLRVVDVSTPSNPTEVGFYDTPGYAERVAVAGGYAYVADHDAGLRVVDVSTPSNPTEVGFYYTPGYAYGVAVAGGYAYVADWNAGLRVVDVSEPSNPTEVGFYDTPGIAYGVAVAGGYAYVANGHAGLRVVDVSTPSNPTEVGFYDTPGYAYGVAVAGGYAYVADGYGGGYYYGGLRVVDVSVPANPTEVGYYDTPGSAHDVAVAGGYAYVADEYAGLLILRYTGGGPAPPCDLSKQPVLLVHGWGGQDVMAKDEMGFAQLYQWMRADGYVEGCNLFYATGIKASNNRIFNAIAIQLNLWAAYNTVTALNPDWRGHFDIIGHSYGGLNARFYLESSRYPDDASYGQYGIHVDNLFTLGSPHGGAIVPDELFPGAILIGLGHLNDKEWLSALDLLADKMNQYNLSRSQPDDICYRLIGGDFIQQYGLWWKAPIIWALYEVWTDIPNDIGVSRRSSLQLGINSDLAPRYGHVVTYANTDMHGYKDTLGLGAVRSYVSPDLTYNEIIAPSLGADMNQCRSSQVNIRSAVDAQPEELAIPPLLIASDTITDGQTITGTVPVDWDGQTAFYVTWMSSDLDLTLRDPAGVVLTPTVAISDPNANYGKLMFGISGLATYIFTNTLTGEWTYTITAESGPYPIPFDLYVNPDSPLVARASAPEWQPFGAPVVITASLFYSTTPISGAAVQAHITRPDGSEDSISLHNDGLPPDNAGGDGIYSGTYTDTTEGGFYYVLVEADGTYASQTYHRTAQAVFPVAADSATLSGTYADQPSDDNGDGLYEYLDVGVGVNGTQLGDFTVAAALQGKNEQYIDLANATVYSSTGHVTLTLRFDGQAIHASGLDGPYTVTEVLLLDDAQLLKLDTADNAWITAAYDHRLFGSAWRIYLPIVLKNY